MRTTGEIAAAIALRMLHADLSGCLGVVEDILTKASAEHGHTAAMIAFDEYDLWRRDIVTDSERPGRSHDQ
jgi:hypothetical protein